MWSLTPYSLLSTYTPMIKLAEIRQFRGKSLRQLSRDAGVALATIQRLEADVYDPRLSTLRRLSKALDVSLASLMGIVPEKGQEITFHEKEGGRMVSKDNFKARNAAIDVAKRALEDWRKKHMKALYRNGQQWGIWPYEHQQLVGATNLLSMLLKNLREEDLRSKE